MLKWLKFRAYQKIFPSPAVPSLAIWSLRFLICNRIPSRCFSYLVRRLIAKDGFLPYTRLVIFAVDSSGTCPILEFVWLAVSSLFPLVQCASAITVSLQLYREDDLLTSRLGFLPYCLVWV